jgi:REP element-mobilizing transposase RayT
MKEGYQFRDKTGIYFLTFTIVDWVDLFSRKIYRDILIESLNFCIKKKHAIVYGYVIMTNHMHIILQSEAGDISGLVRDYKKWTAIKLIEAVQGEPESRRDWLLHRFAYYASLRNTNYHYQIWTHDNHPEDIISHKFFLQKLNYIHQNPVRAGWVEKEEDYVYSSAGVWYGKKGLVPITPWPLL